MGLDYLLQVSQLLNVGYEYAGSLLGAEKRKNGKGVRYYTFPELETMFKNNKLRVFSVYGNYEKEELNINSKRMIIIGKKITQKT